MTRIYHIVYGGQAVNFNGFVYYAEDEVHFENGNTPEYACRQFIDNCEEVFYDGYTTVWFKDIADNMIAMSERHGLGWVVEEYDDTITHEEGWHIYSAEFAKKLHLDGNCVYCFSKKCAEEEVHRFTEEGKKTRCSYKKEPVIMMYPDGSYDEDEAYVVYYAECITLQCFDSDDLNDGTVECGLVETFDGIDEESSCAVTIKDISQTYEVLLTDSGSYARKLA
jgi:hypothetical protein